ncbi:MAG: methyltransferase domain-containing protein [Bacilli bacterium]|nr:methyltransferase domain-containing protein [Bacilli bacterium]
MNTLEKLSNENKVNYQRYLKRMTESLKFSTKGLIPSLVKDANNILDVGCGSGVLLSAIEKVNPKARLTGIDLNKDAIEYLKQNSNWNVYHMNFFDVNEVFDTVIFSSILHEVSSYCDDNNKKFTYIPILEAFEKTRNILVSNGVVVLRDGLECDNLKKDNKVRISFTKPEDEYWLHKFKEDFRGFDKSDINTTVEKVGDNNCIVSEGFLKEFLCTYTWGASSFPREVQEKFGILTHDEWIRLLDETGFEIERIIESEEEYEKYLSPKVSLTYLNGDKYNYPNMSILIRARKKN